MLGRFGLKSLGSRCYFPVFLLVGAVLVSCQGNCSKESLEKTSKGSGLRLPFFASNLPQPKWGDKTLLDKALEIAKENGETCPESIEYLKTHRLALDSSSGIDGTIYLVMMKGHFILGSQPRPRGASAPTGDNLNFTINDKNGQLESLGMNNLPTDLTSLGKIEKLF